ncbi:hypothetical protein HZB02_07780 [Candidatus Woesearchaeota archaeon]|nr:hypothetical protein [Candidatus Woesearchaeota archaeon]
MSLYQSMKNIFGYGMKKQRTEGPLQVSPSPDVLKASAQAAVPEPAPEEHHRIVPPPLAIGSGSLEMLIIEDTPKHLADAKSTASQCVGINFTFASTYEEAEQHLQQKRFHAVASDIFFPLKAGEQPTSHGALNLGKLLDDAGTPFVYNTSGNHHGEQYEAFRDARSNMGYKMAGNTYGFSTGKIIEAYLDTWEEEKGSKQWSAAINYAILLAYGHGVENAVLEKVGEILKFAPYGDYGKLTEKMEAVLDHARSIEHLFKDEPSDRCPWSIYAMDDVQDQHLFSDGSHGKEWTWNEQGSFVSLRSTKEDDERLFSELEATYKQPYVQALDFIRTTIAKYQPNQVKP